MLDFAEVARLAWQQGLLVTPEAAGLLEGMSVDRRNAMLDKAQDAELGIIDAKFVSQEICDSDVSVPGTCAPIGIEEDRADEESITMLELKRALFGTLKELAEAGKSATVVKMELKKAGVPTPGLVTFATLQRYLIGVYEGFQDDINALYPGIFEGIQKVAP